MAIASAYARYSAERRLPAGHLLMAKNYVQGSFRVMSCVRFQIAKYRTRTMQGPGTGSCQSSRYCHSRSHKATYEIWEPYQKCRSGSIESGARVTPRLL
jgi:hypothetical protein